MKKFWITFLVLSLSCGCCFSEDDWDDFIKIDTEAKNQQKVVTEDEFEKTMKMFEKKPTWKEKRAKKKMGDAIIPNAQDSSMKTDVYKGMYETYPTMMIPAHLVTNDMQEVPIGYYRIMSVSKSGTHYLNFYQGNALIAKIKANPTDNDYNQKTLNYAKIIPISDNQLRIIYGDLDCNLETVVNIKPNM